MKQKLVLDKWARKDHFQFFNNFDEPFWGVVINIDCTKAYKFCKENNDSFYLYYLHKSLVAANEIEEFRYRIEENDVVIFDKIHASATVLRSDNSFDFSYMPYHENFSEFSKNAKAEINRIQNTTGLSLGIAGNDVIHYSSLPWLNFTSISHARNFSYKDSCPKISFGKMTEQNDIKSMPISIHVTHALLDGFHVGQFVELFQKLMNENK